MKWRLNIWFLLLLFTLISQSVFATHIVGGSLTYVHNGGSSYTVTLKLYRDCAPGTAGFDNNITITVLGNNGVAFNPSRNISIPIGSVTVLSSPLNPCAIEPNPKPCVQEAIYTKTVNNLPPNAGGYHLYWQKEARNLTINNTNAACNCVGSSFYAYIPGESTMWVEDFALNNNTTNDNGATAWSRTVSNNNVTANVQNQQFRVTGSSNRQATWTSQVINITGAGTVKLSADLFEDSNLDNTDSILVYYRLNGGALIPFPSNGAISNDFTSAVASATGITGSTVQIVIRVHFANNNNNKTYRFDNVTVSRDNFVSNSDPVFNQFPPIYLCRGQNFTFDHSATDPDGDSLVYDFYTPYNGDDGNGPLDPTFPGNVATFTPIVWNGGYSTNSPLGNPPLNLNPSTGLLTGIANTLGQFVVGVRVKEYRNGVYLSETLRDFQFNVINCPIPPPPYAGPDITINQGCNLQISATGFVPSSITWTSVAPGNPGDYNSYLSCTSGCSNPSVTQPAGAPAFVDFQACGIAASCDSSNVCDIVRVFFNPPLQISINPGNPIICPGQTSTSLSAVASGGTAPYSYLWNNINPSPNITVGVGTYTVRLSDASGCPPEYASVTVTNTVITANAGTDQTICKQNPATVLTGSVTGASGGVWSGGGGTFSPNTTTLSGATYTPTAAELAAGVVNLTLTTTGNGTCQPATDIVTINYVDFTGTITPSSTPVSCFGGNNGTATINITGGMPPYIYSWNSVPAQTTQTATGLTAGIYTVTTTNNIGCTITNTVTVSEPPKITIGSTISNVSCPSGNDGSITVTAAGGTPAYTYLWQSGGQTTAAISNLTANTYTIIVTDANLCKDTANYTVAQPDPITISLTSTPASCYNGSDGTATSTVSGGTAPYTYSWSSGATAPTATGLAAGTYTLTVTDNKNCIETATITIAQPPVYTVTTSTANETCDYLNNGSASATVSGGTPSYTYLWQPGGQTTASVSGLSAGTYTLTVTDSNGCPNVVNPVITEPTPVSTSFISIVDVSCNGGNDGVVTANPNGGTPGYTYLWTLGGETTATISNLQAGTYTVIVTDANGCKDTASQTVSEATTLTASTSNTNETCDYQNNGTATVTASGGTPNYTYLWQPSLQTTATASNLGAGTYTVTITDSKGCNTTATATITEPAPLTANFSSQTNASCFGNANGAATVSPTGGTTPYTYLWSNGQTTASATGLTTGTYSVTVTDNAGCTATNALTITQPVTLDASITKTDETCDYLNNGTATAQPVGGTAPYTYLWNNGQTAATATNLAAGTYTITVTDANGCTALKNIAINQPAPLVISFTSTNVSCFAGNDGTIAASTTGGTPNYTYLWATSGTTNAAISNLTAGNYTVTVTDANSCTTSNSTTITQPTDISLNISSTNKTCDYLDNGTATVIPSGGTPVYTYLWLPGGQNTAAVTGLDVGTFTVVVTDNNGCVDSTTTSVNQPAQLTANFNSQTNASCFGNANGAATVSPTGGTTPYTYLWSNGQTTASATGLTSGTYSVTVTDNAGCTAMNAVNITQPATLDASITKTNETCNYLNNGTATAQTVGGTTPYTYLWNNGQTAATATNLAAGTYTVTVTDANNCTVNKSITINEPLPMAITFTPISNVSCFGGSNGSVALSTTGGTPNYTYLWSPGGETTNGISNLSAGTYTVTVTDSRGCNANNSIIITQPSLPLSVSASATPTSCNGGNDGTATAIASGGTATYSYSWEPNELTGAMISSLNAGTYTVTATDAKGCTSADTVTVTEPSPIVLVTSSTNADCGQATGSTSVAASGGTAPYTYLWSPTGGTSDTATGLLTGAYTVLVTDAEGCTASQWGNVNENTAPTAIIFDVINVSCYGGNDGAAFVMATGGISPYTYSWLPTGGADSAATGLTAGTYTVTVTGANGCQSLATTSPAITQPTPITIATTRTPVSCFGGNNGSASALAAGGTPGYSYMWLPNSTTGTTANNLTAGTYTIQVTDDNGCVRDKPVTIIEPTEVDVTIINIPVSCYNGNDGTATATASGGTAPYSYVWMPGNISGPAIGQLTEGTYTVTVTDANGCIDIDSVTITQPTQITTTMSSVNSKCSLANGQASVVAVGGTPFYSYSWSPAGGANSLATGLMASSYTVTITDNNGCVVTDTITVHDSSSPIATVTTTTNVTCNGANNGTATVTVTNGTAPYTYLWSPSGNTDSIATGLTPGTHTVVVTDNNGCQSLPAVSTNITQPNPVIITINKNNVSCFGGNNGSATANVTGGTPTYSYLWSPNGETTPTISNLIAGTYTVQVTDANMCPKSQTVIITQPSPALTLTKGSTPVSCYNGNNGTASVNVTGGTIPYNYQWLPGNFTGANVGQLTAGDYTVTVTDAKGCTVTDSVEVTQPTEIITTMSSINSNCGLANGQASVVVAGGIPGYTYSWIPAGGGNPNATNLMANLYTVTITDNNGCNVTDTITVHDNSSPVASVTTTTNITCNGANNGTATVSVTGGTAPFTYVWSPSGSTDSIATGLTPGTHTVVVTDNNGCQSLPAVSTNITQPNPVMITVNKNNVSCFGGNNGNATANVTGGTPVYTYLWSPNGETTPAINNLIAGTYTVQVTDANMCPKSQVITITQPSPALAITKGSTPVSCFNGNNGTASVSVTGGTIPYNYLWLPGNFIGSGIGQLTAGDYTVTVTDAKGCMVTDSVTVTQPTEITTSMSSLNSNCGLANGQASVIAAGGIPGYSYSWSPAGGNGLIATGLMASLYTVTVTDNNGCNVSDTITVHDNSSPVATVSSITNITCNGANDGTATITVTGGAAPFTYLWSPSGSTDSTATGLTTGVHTVVVTDNNGCQSLPAVSASITQPQPLYIQANKTMVSCFGNSNGALSATVLGGTPAYTYLWSVGGNTNPSISNLTAGSYTLHVTDANNCMLDSVFVITQPNILSASITANTPVSCFGGTNGAATVSVTGGTPVYSYNWQPYGGNGATASGLAAGTYTVAITDNNGCNTSSTATITQPLQALSATPVITNSSCNGSNDGQIVVQATGGTPNYTYQWMPSVSTNDTANNLAVGSYSIRVTDNKACETIITASITQPTVLTGSLSRINPSCSQSNGSITSMVSGGTAPYTYLWMPGSLTTSTISNLGTGSYTLSVTDNNGCPLSLTTSLSIAPDPVVNITSSTNVSCYGSSNGSATAVITQGTTPYTISWSPYGGNSLTAIGLDSGVYIVHVTDALGCQTSDTISITEPETLSPSIASQANVLCNGGATGTASVAVTGGTPPYSYLWQTGGQNTSNPTNLTAGTHTVTVTDNNGCSRAISVFITEPPVLSSVIDTIIYPVCSNTTGSVTVLPLGGTPSYSYAWSAPADTVVNSTAFFLMPGSYTVTVTDNNGCTTNNNLVITAPTQVITTSGTDDTLCLGQSGSITASASGGSGSYLYAWQPSGVINGGTLNVNPTVSTTYTVVAYDQNGCSGNEDTIRVTVYDINAAILETYGTTPICPGQNTYIYSETSGNTGPLTYTWNNGLGTGPGGFLVIPTEPTTYVVTATNVCGASISDSIAITFNPPPIVDLTALPSSVCAYDMVLFNDNSISGNPDDPIISWIWNFGDGNQSTEQYPSHSYSTSGNYVVTLTVTTGGGCTNSNLSNPFTVTTYPSPVAAFSMSSTYLYLPYDVLTINNQSTGAVTYNWNFGDGGISTEFNPHYPYSTIGNFQVQLVATNQYGCTDTATAEVTTDADIKFPNAFTPNDNGPSGGYYDVNNYSNDIFFPYTSGVVDYKLQIFNRWGELIFESFDVKQGWDGYYRGQLCQQDVYVWKAYVRLSNGKIFDKAGDLTLLK